MVFSSKLFGVSSIEVGADLCRQALTRLDSVISHINSQPAQALHVAVHQRLRQIVHPLHAVADGGGGQLFAQHGDGVQLVAAAGRAGAGNRGGGA